MSERHDYRSLAVSRTCVFGWFDGVAGDALGREAQPHPCAAPAGGDLGRIEQLHAAAVLLQNAPDNGETKAGALLARRDIGLEQPVAIFLRQAGAVVDHVDHDLVALALDRDSGCGRVPSSSGGTAAIASVAFFTMLVSAWRDQPPVELRRHLLGFGLELDVDVRIADALQEDDLPRRIGDVLGGHHRLRHAGEARELVHHALDVVDLAHDRVGALLEHRFVLGDHLAVLALQPLGRKLDRGQRILDLVRDAARDVGPGRGALRRDQVGDVVERHHIAAVLVGRLLGGDAHRQIALAHVAADRDLSLHQPVHAGCALR